MLNFSGRRVFVASRVLCPIRYVRFSPFSLDASKSISETANKNAFIANYLIGQFGFSKEKALISSKYFTINSPDKAESVIAFLKNRGFPADQIKPIVRNCPQILRYNPYKIFTPKIDFLLSSGISQTQVNNIFVEASTVFLCSLGKQIIPSVNYFKSFLEANGTSLASMKRLPLVFSCNLESLLIPNIEILRDAGVRDSNIIMLLQNKPRTLVVETEKFREVVNEVKQMDFSPGGGMFTYALCAIRSMSKSMWEKKMTAYMKWGLSEIDIKLAFRKQPYIMTLSTDRINAAMDFIVNEMELEYSFVVERPGILICSLEKRLKPRYSIHKILVANGLIKKGYFLKTIFIIAEKDFVNKFVHVYEKEIPRLFECYQKKLAVSKS